MRIISKNKDYYDAALAYGVDPNIVWVRDPRDVDGEKVKSKITRKDQSAKIAKFPDIGFKTNGKHYDIDADSVYFCGRRVNYLKVGVSKEEYSGKEWTYFYNFEHFQKHAEKVLGKSGMKYLTGEKQVRRHWYQDEVKDPLGSAAKYLEKEIEVTDDVFIELNTPIFKFVGQTYKPYYTVNQRLIDFQFIKHLDPYQCFQQLSMYCSSTLMMNRKTSSKYKGQKLMADISDLDMRDAKGFNKYSFRKDKGK